MTFSIISWQSAIICAAYFAAGLIDSICGGGGLVTVPALMALGVPVHSIAGTNQCSALLGNFASIYKYLRSGSIRFKPGLIAALTAIPGGIIGAKLNIFIPEQYLKIIMIVLMPAISLLLLFKKDFGNEDQSDSVSSGKVIAYSALIGIACGAYQGFYGPGSGMLYMLGFALLIRLDLVCASGTAKIATLFAAISSSVTYAFSGLVFWQIALIATAFNITGNYLGAHLAITNGARIIRPFLFFVIALLFITLLVR